MIGVFESGKPETAFLAYVVPVLNGNSQRGLHRAGAIAGEQNSSAHVGEDACKSVGQFGGAGVRKVAKNTVLELLRLTDDGLDEPGVTVAQVAGPPRRDCVHVPVAFAVEQEDPLAPRNYGETVPERRVPGVWMPKTCQIKLAVVLGKIFHKAFIFLLA